MSGDRYYGWSKEQWHRVAAFWMAGKGALPPVEQDAAVDLMTHWMDRHTEDPPDFAEPHIVDADGKPMWWIPREALIWVARTFASASLERIRMKAEAEANRSQFFAELEHGRQCVRPPMAAFKRFWGIH